MHRIILFFILVFCFPEFSPAQDTMQIEGAYQGQNLYVQNPFTATGKGFCVQKVLVNDSEIRFENASAFEVDLKLLNLKINDKIKLKIIHGSDCLPKLLNPCIDCNTKAGYYFLSALFTGDEYVSWQCVEHGGKFTYVIEQYRWNKWIKCGEMYSTNGMDTMSYSFSVKKYLHSGENQFRVKVVDLSGTKAVSSEIKISESKIDPFIIKQDEMVILFADQTLFEVYDQNGRIVDRGFATAINPHKYPKGAYYLNYDNHTMEFRN
jgi:hypothetical protein